MNAVSWSYANKKFNARKGDYAQRIRDGYILPGAFVDILKPSHDDRILHLMCNDGREAAALSFRYGPRLVGVDFSSEAIKFARSLNDQLRLSNNFVNAEILEYLSGATKVSHNKIMLTLGSLRWITNLDQFFLLCAARLSVGGYLILWDFHPLVQCIDHDRHVINAFPFEPRVFVRQDGVRDYTGRDDWYHLFDRIPDYSDRFVNPHPVTLAEYSCSHVITKALENEHFQLRSFAEYPFSWEERCFCWLRLSTGGVFEPRDGEPSVPATFALKFERSSKPWRF